jgi:hypothetical protein
MIAGLKKGKILLILDLSAWKQVLPLQDPAGLQRQLRNSVA